jgi:1,4-dihydroxy-2-naphthoate polyprenyltransferase
MKINFAMWRKAAWELIKMDDKKEWDALDIVSKWLIATRSAVTTVTVYSCIIAGLLAWRDGFFSWGPFLVLTLSLFIAHGTNNLLNDYTDFSRGVDKDNYFRTQYGVHPLVQGFWTKSQQIQWFIASGILATLGGIYSLLYTGFNPTVIGLFIFGALVLLFYTWPLKYWALGELAIFLIWGPIMISGVYFVLALGAGVHNPANLWYVALAGIPFGLSVASINIGKHIDKSEDDRKKGVGTFPVRAGEKFARYINQAAVVLTYLVIVYLVVVHYFTPIMLIVFFAGKRALLVLGVLTKPRPVEPPKEWPGWPTWFSGFAFYHNRMFGGLLILGLILDSTLRIIPFTADILAKYWPM